MSVPSEIRNLTSEVVASFESGIGAVGALIEKGLELLDGYRMEQEAIRGHLREKLASMGSFRRKDFDSVIGRILDFQLRRETEIKTLIRSFLARQRELTSRLNRSMQANLFEEMERCKKELSFLIERVRSEIQVFQKEQQKIRAAFRTFEEKDEVSGREFRKSIQNLEGELIGQSAVKQQVNAL